MSPDSAAHPDTGCPSEITLAAWLDGRLADDAGAALEAHVARCERCCGLIAAINADLYEQRPDERSPTIDDATLRSLESLVPPSESYRFVARASAWTLRVGAAAAAVAIAWGGFSIGASFDGSSSRSSGSTAGATTASTSTSTTASSSTSTSFDALVFGLFERRSESDHGARADDSLDSALRSLLTEVSS
ncbi:MAG: zf-HC2 domain-containing protein [Phycisphaerales bacterium]